MCQSGTEDRHTKMQNETGRGRGLLELQSDHVCPTGLKQREISFLLFMTQIREIQLMLSVMKASKWVTVLGELSLHLHR